MSIFDIKITKLDWLQDAMPSASQLLKLLSEDRIPENIKGWMLLTMCIRLLRCIYGSDEKAIRELILVYESKRIENEVLGIKSL